MNRHLSHPTPCSPSLFHCHPPRRRPLSRRCRLSHHGRHTVHPAAQPTRTTERTCVESATPPTSHVATRILQPHPCSWQPSHCCQCAPASRSNRPGRENARRFRQAKSQGCPQAINPASRQPPQTTSNRRSDGQRPTGGEIGNYCVSCPLTFFPSTRARVRTGCRAFPVFLLSPNTRLTRSSSHPFSSAISPIMQLTSRLAAADPARAQRLAMKTGARGRRNAISLNGAPTGKVIELWKEWVTRRWNPEAKFLNLEVRFAPCNANWFSTSHSGSTKTIFSSVTASPRLPLRMQRRRHKLSSRLRANSNQRYAGYLVWKVAGA